MKSIALLVLTLIPAAAFGQKKEIVELQRDMALLQDQMRTLQRSQDEQFSNLKTLVERALDAANKANTSMAVLQHTLTDRIGEQAKSVVAPVAGVVTKVDQMSDEFRSVRESVADLAGRMGKMEARLVDIANAVTTLRNPPAAPGPDQSGGLAPGVSAEQTYQNAFRDMQGGQLDLALQQFSDYLKYFPNTDYAPNAQFYLGDIYLRKGDTDNAIQAFDAVLERYSENHKSADARYMKGRALIQAGKPTAAAEEFRELIKRYPDGEHAARAKAQLKALGLSAPSAAARKRTRKD
jgi:tol-pal system protein YbgF